MDNTLLLSLNIFLCTLAVLLPTCFAYFFIRWVNFKYAKPVVTVSAQLQTHPTVPEVTANKIKSLQTQTEIKEDIPMVNFKKPKVVTHLNMDK